METTIASDPTRGAAPQIAHPTTTYPITGSDQELVVACIDMDRSIDTC